MNIKDKEILMSLSGTVDFWCKLTGITIDPPIYQSGRINLCDFVVVATNAPCAIGGLKRLREICQALNS